MIPPRRTRSDGARAEDEDKPRVGRMENGSSFTVGGNGPVVERVRISDDTDGNMPTCGSAMPKPPVDLREEFDDYGNELARDARIWRAYVKEAEKCDEDMVDGWNRSLDVILGARSLIRDLRNLVLTVLLYHQYSTQAALFSAILTAFAIESAKNLRQDPAEDAAASMSEAVSILRAIAAGQYVNSSSNTVNNTPEFIPPLSAICVNTLWFLSLSLSVSVSLVAMLAKQWCHSYMSGRTGQSYVQARRRQRRLDGLKRWKMAEILAFLPTLMHVSLILFFIGLTIYLWSIHAAVATPVLAITALTFIFYAATTILPVGSAYCPYSTPLSQYIELALRKILAPIKNTTFAQHFSFAQHESQMPADLANPIPDDLTSRMLAWLISSSQDTRSVDLALQAIAGADSRMPVQPLVQRAVVTCLVRRFMGCFTVHPRTGLASLANDALIETASLYGRALAFVIANAPAQINVASEVQIQYETKWFACFGIRFRNSCIYTSTASYNMHNISINRRDKELSSEFLTARIQPELVEIWLV